MAKGRLGFFVFLAVCGVSLAASAQIALEALALSEVVDPPVDRTLLDPYQEKQAAALHAVGPADDLALGGSAGESTRAKALGYQRMPIEAAMASVTHELEAGDFAPVAVTPEQQATLDRLAMGNVTPEAILAASKDPAQLEAGKAAFATTCVACHGPAGAGLVGPNLTDTYALHGFGPVAVYKVISQGVGAKGMPPWNALGEEKLTQLTAYVMSLYGTNVAGKAPQGVDPQGNQAPAQ